MRQSLVVFLCLGSVAMFGQTPISSTEALANKRIELAQQQVEKIAALVEMGALPRIRLDQAREELADAQDDATLAKTLYSGSPLAELSGNVGDEMVAAAERRVDRQKARVEQTKKLIADGIEALSAVTPLEQELSMRQTTLDLANSRVRLAADMASLAKLEESIAASQDTPSGPGVDRVTDGMEHFEGNATFVESRDLQPIETAFARHFDKPLPISADGETNLHRSLGLDHRGRVDVAVNPNTTEGIWLRDYLKARQIPYYAFTQAMPGKATGAHIHIGPGSTRLNAAD